MKEWSTGYLAYCKAHGFEGEPEEMKKYDCAKEYRDGVYAGFMVWLKEKRKEFFDLHPGATKGWFWQNEKWTLYEQDAFSEWLVKESVK